jgi:hypothetical protein
MRRHMPEPPRNLARVESWSTEAEATVSSISECTAMRWPSTSRLRSQTIPCHSSDRDRGDVVVASYNSLANIERDLRKMKSVDVHIRPNCHRGQGRLAEVGWAFHRQGRHAISSTEAISFAVELAGPDPVKQAEVAAAAFLAR